MVLHGKTVFYGKGYNVYAYIKIFPQISTQFNVAADLAYQQDTEMTTEFLTTPFSRHHTNEK